jgi:hypothetical protein
MRALSRSPNVTLTNRCATIDATLNEIDEASHARILVRQGIAAANWSNIQINAKLIGEARARLVKAKQKIITDSSSIPRATRALVFNGADGAAKFSPARCGRRF